MINFTELSNILNANALYYLYKWLPGGKIKGSEYLIHNPLREDKHPSLSINYNTGKWADFAINQRGRDLISLYAYINGLKNGEAAKQLQQIIYSGL
jgi:hypothetical protein